MDINPIGATPLPGQPARSQTRSSPIESKVIFLAQTILKPENAQTVFYAACLKIHATKENLKDSDISNILQKNGFSSKQIDAIQRKISDDAAIAHAIRTAPNYMALSRSEAEQLLQKAPEGCWLIRWSASEDQYVKTIKTEKGFAHLRLNPSEVNAIRNGLDPEKNSYNEMLLDKSVLRYASIENKSRDEATQILDREPAGTWLITHDPQEDSFHVLVKTGNESILQIKIEENRHFHLNDLNSKIEIFINKESRSSELIALPFHETTAYLILKKGEQIDAFLRSHAGQLNQMAPEQRFQTIQEASTELPLSTEAAGRFSNIGCPALTSLRVENEVLHANFVELGSHRFICAQAPLLGDEPLFWKAAMEQTDLIVDLTNESDKINRKLTDYFPLDVKSHRLHHGDVNITVKLIGEKTQVINPRLTAYTYEVTDYQTTPPATKTITRLHYQGWPDHGSIADQEFLDVLQTSENYKSARPLVHCTAGVGRTGTFCVGSVLIDEIRNGAIDKNNYLECIDRLILQGRYQRGLSFTQTQQQYESLLSIAKRELLIKDTVVSLSDRLLEEKTDLTLQTAYLKLFAKQHNINDKTLVKIINNHYEPDTAEFITKNIENEESFQTFLAQMNRAPNYMPLSHAEAVSRLENTPVNTWLIRWEISQSRYVVTQKTAGTDYREWNLDVEELNKITTGSSTTFSVNDMLIDQNMLGNLFSVGEMDRTQANDTLSKEPIGTWLVRYSPQQKSYVFSIKTSNNQYIHDNQIETVLNINQVLDKLGTYPELQGVPLRRLAV